MRAKIKSMRIQYVATFKNDCGEWEAVELSRDVDGFDGKATKAAAERELAQPRLDGSTPKFYNIISVSAVTKTIEI